MKKENLPLVSGKMEDIILDLKKVWSDWGFLFVVLNMILAAIAVVSIARKRLK